jgi:hypothetical protein
MTEIVSDMTAARVYQNFAIDRVVYGKPAVRNLDAALAWPNFCRAKKSH